MSFGAASEDYWSKTAGCSIRERCKLMFNNKLLSDVKFAVRDAEGGSERMKTIPAHKFVLAISSQVFFAMFYGELAEKKDSINISDCEYRSLLEVFRFIYSDEVNLNAENVMQVLYLAKKYMLLSLVDKCTEYLGENLDASNVFHVLPEAQKYEEEGLVDKCWEVIDKHGDEAVKSDGFVTIERSVLEELVERDSLNVKEVELFKAVDCWARKECEKKNQIADGSVKRRILGERIVKAIRFPVMEEKEFANAVLDCDILTQKEAYDMVKYFNSVLTLPVGFLDAKRSGCLHRIFRFQSVEGEGWHYSLGFSNSIILSVDKNIKLHSVRLFGRKNNEYSVTLKLSSITHGCVLATETGTFQSKLVSSDEIEYYGFDIAFKRPVALESNIKYCFEASISGPHSMFGISGLPSVRHGGIRFSFTNQKKGSITNVSNGQFPELEFSLN